MLSKKNNVIIAAAGSGKTTNLVKRSIRDVHNRILITTFTIENLEEIRKKFYLENGYVPKNIEVKTWFSFLLSECVRPYQNVLYEHRIENIEFVSGQSTVGISRDNIEAYYFRSGKYIYTDKICDFVCKVNNETKGAIINRLEKLYDVIMIDEVQDLAGYDLDFLGLLIKSNIKIILVGDNRQATYFTNNSKKNKKFKGNNIFELFKNWEKENLCSIEYISECFRCNQLICDLADSLYPNYPRTKSLNYKETGHDGVFYIHSKDVHKYVEKFSPQILRYDKRTPIPSNLKALNFGKSKGLTFNRVLIFSNGPINNFLRNGNIKAAKTKALLYVAITRARYSVTFVTEEKDVANDYIKEFII